MNDFSDPAWWPTPPPKPPKAVSTPKLVFGTLLPVVIGVIALVVLLTHKHHKTDAATGRSIAAFTACMKEQGADSPAVQANTRMLNLDAIACKDHLPKGVQLPDFNEAAGGGQQGGDAFQQCMRSAYVNLRGAGGGGRFGSGSRKAFQDAQALCRSLTQHPGASPPT